MEIITNPETDYVVEAKNVGVSRRLRPTDPDVFSNPDSARVRARQLGCIGIRRYDSQSGGYVWMPCTNESDYRRQMGTSHSGRLQRRREIQTEIRRFVRGKALEEIDEKSGAYTKPELRNRIKNRIMAGSKGGRPGQWSARKAQLLAQAYRKAGGGYKGGKDKRQRSLSRWTRQDWTTSDGKPANRPGGMRRYLPRAAWSRLTPAQVRATNRKKIQGSRSGSQFVRNTESAMNAARNARKQLNELMFNQKALGATIGRTRRGLRGVTARFDPDARDADSDKIIQEGTIYERPDTPNKPELTIPAVRRIVVPEQQTVARRMRRIDDGSGLIGAMADNKNPKKGVKTRTQRSDTVLSRLGNPNADPPPEGSRIVSVGRWGKRPELPNQGVEDLANILIDRGLYFKRKGKGDHFIYAMDFVAPDGSKYQRQVTLYATLDMGTLRDKAIDAGMLPLSAVGQKPGAIKLILAKQTKYNLKKEQKDAIFQAFDELAQVDVTNADGKDPFPGFFAIERRAQEIAAAPIPLQEIRNFLENDDSGRIKRSIAASKRRAKEIGAQLQKAKGRLSPEDQRWWNLWTDVQKSETDPINSLSQLQQTELLAELGRIPSDPSYLTSIQSDLDLVAEFGPINFYGVEVPKANLDPRILDRITLVSRAKNPEFYDFAEWRRARIAKGEYLDNLEEAKSKLGGLSGAMRADGSRRFSRRYYRASGLTGAMSGDERKSDYARKQRIWQANIISQVLLRNQAEAIRRQNMTPEQLAKEPPLPFPNWTEQFGTLDVATISGAPGVTSFSHRVVDLLYKRLEREWGPNETQIFGEIKSFKIWDAPMSRLDIENLGANKRKIVAAFIEETVKLDPNSPFAQFDPVNMPDSDVDMLWRSYVIPELLKQPGTSVMPMDDIPFEIDPTKEELIRNYTEYLELKKLGLQTAMTQQDFDSGMAELLDSTSKDFEDFVGQINKAYDEYKQTGTLPGQFTDESLINPDTGNIFTEEEWRKSFDQAAQDMMEKTSRYNEAAQELAVAQGLYGSLWEIGLRLKYLKPEDMENLNDDAADAIDNMQEIDPLPDLDPRDLTFDSEATTKLAQDSTFGWMWRRFVRNARDWAYPLAEKYHGYDIQQHRYVRPDFIDGDQYEAPKTERVDPSKLDWDKLLELIEASSHLDDIDLPGVKSIIAKSRETRAKKLAADKKTYVDSKTAAGQAERDKIWTMFETDGLTAQEIAAKLDISGSVVDRVLKNESKSRGLTTQQFNALGRKAASAADSREEQFRVDLANSEVARIKEITKGTPESYLDTLREARQYYKDVSTEANASYRSARRRYAELATLANMLLMDLPDGRKWDPNKESAANFKNRWLRRVAAIYPTLVTIAGQVDAMQWHSDDRVSASRRILDRAGLMIRRIDVEIERAKAVTGITDLEDLRKRHNIQAISVVKELARKAIRGQHPNMTDAEIDKLFESTGTEDGLTGAMAGAIRGASRGKKARELFKYSSRNSGDRRGFLSRLADTMPDMRHNQFVKKMAEWLDGLEDQFSSPRARTRRMTGNFPASSRAQLRARRTLNEIRRANQDDFGLARSARERQMIRGLSRSAKKSKINVRRYFDGRDDQEDIKWSSNDWSYGKVKPIRAADMVVYRRNPNEKDPLKSIEVLVIDRKSGPFTGARALPGGLNDEGETLVETATREVREEVGISTDGMQVQNLGIIQSRDWDPRFVEGVTVQGMSVKVPYSTEAVAGSDAKKARFVPLAEILDGDGHIAFGHAAFMKEALKNEDFRVVEKLEIHERAGRIRNRRLIEKININRQAAGQKLFPVASDDEVDKVFDLIRPSNPRYSTLNDPASGLTGAMSQRYDIRVNSDGTFDIIDTQNNNARIAGPFKSRKQALYGAIRKDREPGFDPQILLGRRKKKPGAKKATRKRRKPEQLSLNFGDNETASRLDQSKDGLTGAITTTELLTTLGIQMPASTMQQSDFSRGVSTLSHYQDRQVVDAITGDKPYVNLQRFNSLWVPYREGVQAIVPDAERRAQPIIYLIGGPSGSLKSTIRESGLAGIPTRTQAITIDPDEVKLITPEYFALTVQKNRIAANIVHDESKAVAINSLKLATLRSEGEMRVLRQGKDIVYDSLGQLQDSEITDAIEQLRVAGYKVIGYYFFADEDTASKRMRERARRTGRRVPNGLYDQSMNGIQSRIGNSIRNRDLFDELVMFDTSDASNIQRAVVYIKDPAQATALLSANPPQGRTVNNARKTRGQLTIEPITRPDGTVGDSFLIQALNIDRLTNH
jgi:ADP-ribose pyrophosphatase YjhB (NUDIX family)/predicted ABC-type ATPase/transposase